MSRTPTYKTIRQQSKMWKQSPAAPMNSFQRSLKEREENLKLQRSKLDLAWKKLNEDIAELEEEKKRNEDLKTELRLWEDIRGKQQEEAEEDESVLSRTLYELQQHLNLVKKDLFICQKKKEILMRKNSEVDPILENEIYGKSQTLSTIQQMIDYINNDLTKHENETLQKEEEAKQHQIAILEAEDRHKEIIRRKISAESEKAMLQKRLEELKKQNEVFETNKKAATEKLNAAKEEEKKLDEEDKEIEQKQKDLDEKMKELEELKSKYEELKLEAAQKEIEKRKEEDERLKKIVLQPIEDKNVEEDYNTLLIELDLKKSELLQREKMLELEENRIADDFNAQKKSLEDAINYLKENLKNSKEDSEKAEETKQKADQLNSEIKEKQNELENLKKEMKTKEEMEKIDKELEAEKKEVDDMEKELSEVLAKLQRDEEETDKEEEELKFNLEKLQNERIVLQEKEKQMNEKLQIYQKELENSQERLVSLTNSI
ncbi:hypothetical protein TVAG_361190 [Trichomonas vaginalis G3]|uniref:Uncharacterized protein n=1 Tax=Trichomonas vaginalis (strain ATCC PRA-98 / G3) TaxID=412133 RepID=A2FNF6_TRIV3|nr:biological adhesion protein [Trichomonas vaginalis G3]EAX93564.1 hypothetical protein TVAG_361190 [Trichomonas vaginalis G3]KAI5501482.1 biological adhesion protein [Trichomonas vaginalis G3]|eukprot:XP_001306494.1 hypothetical protein [Trichomonas vaginalis G3]